MGRRQSTNIEDRRGGGGMRMGIGGGVGALVLMLIVYLMGGDPRRLLQELPQEAHVPDAGSGAAVEESPHEAQLRELSGVVLADTEETWHALFRRSGHTYQEPKLVLFRRAIDSACGFAGSAVGPFYCPADGKVYLDLSFYEDLRERFGAPGEFAQAYVLAHEIGHHVQNLLGISDRVLAARERSGGDEASALSVRLELQADCLAGIWAHHADRERQFLEEGDIEDGLRAASAIGDDRIQMETQGYVVPESFTHGSSEQRVAWFKRGIQAGRLEECDTFAE